jgi:hypothetical protein
MIPVRTVFSAVILQVSLIILQACSTSPDSSVKQDAETWVADSSDAEVGTDADVRDDALDALDAAPDGQPDAQVDLVDGSCDVSNVRQVCEWGKGAWMVLVPRVSMRRTASM